MPRLTQTSAIVGSQAPSTKTRVFFRPPSRIPKVVFANAAINDHRIIGGPAGLLLQLISKSRRGLFSFKDILHFNSLERPHKIRKYLNSLIDAGYLRMVPIDAQSNPVFGVRYAVNRYVEITDSGKLVEEKAEPARAAIKSQPTSIFDGVGLPPIEHGLAWIYAVAAGPIIKIGTSIRVAIRLRKLAEERPLGLCFLFAYAVPRDFAATVERRIHRRLRVNLISGEWFLVEARTVEESITTTIAQEFDLPIRRYPEIETAQQFREAS